MSVASTRNSAASGAPYPLVGVALLVVVLHAIVVATLPPNPYRSAITIAALFATGYCAVALIIGRTVRLSPAEILAFSVGLTILITSVSALSVSMIGIPITDFAITVIGLPVAAAAWFLRGARTGTRAAVVRSLHAMFDFSDYSRSEKALAGVLLAGIAVALVAFLLLSTVLYPDRLSPGLAIVGPDGTAGSLPTAFDRSVPQAITVSALGGSAGEVFLLRVRLIPLNATANQSFHATPFGSPIQMDPFAESVTNVPLGPGGTWSQSLTVAIQASGDFYLRFDLIDASSAVVASNQLPIVVT